MKIEYLGYALSCVIICYIFYTSKKPYSAYNQNDCFITKELPNYCMLLIKDIKRLKRKKEISKELCYMIIKNFKHAIKNIKSDNNIFNSSILLQMKMLNKMYHYLEFANECNKIFKFIESKTSYKDYEESEHVKAYDEMLDDIIDSKFNSESIKEYRLKYKSDIEATPDIESIIQLMSLLKSEYVILKSSNEYYDEKVRVTKFDEEVIERAKYLNMRRHIEKPETLEIIVFCDSRDKEVDEKNMTIEKTLDTEIYNNFFNQSEDIYLNDKHKFNYMRDICIKELENYLATGDYYNSPTPLTLFSFSINEYTFEIGIDGNSKTMFANITDKLKGERKSYNLKDREDLYLKLPFKVQIVLNLKETSAVFSTIFDYLNRN